MYRHPHPRSPTHVTCTGRQPNANPPFVCRHASRRTITTDDVLLLARRNDTLEGLLRDFVEEDKARRDRDKVGAAAAKGKAKAAGKE